MTLATRPVLLYYSIMHLALAEILFKQTGDSNLERARSEHRHHGLKAKVSDCLAPDMGLLDSASCLSAEPMTRQTDLTRFGTFEVWHRSAREPPLLGEWRSIPLKQQSFRVLMGSEDIRLPEIPASGVSLLDCFRNMPSMYQFMNFHQLKSQLIRGRCEAVERENDTTFTFIIHPCQKQELAEFCSQVRISSSTWEQFQVEELASGVVLRLVCLPGLPETLHLPMGASYGKDEIYFSTLPVPLNEFGYFYVALFILGSFARYYPDKWMRDIERAAPLSLAVEALATQFEIRVPILALSELQQELLVVE